MFYRTVAIDDNAMAGSGMRPARLLDAFRRLGYEVDVVAGPASARKAAARAVRRKINSGVAYDFVYAEPPTTPVLLNEKHHLPTHPLMDYRFLSFCHSRGIPLVLFYCDVQWRLPDYPRRIGWAKYLAALPFFHLDLAVYRRIVDALLVPHLGMLPQIARWTAGKPSWASIPGFDPLETPPRHAPTDPNAPLRLFYVGGVTPPVYDLGPLLAGSALAASRGVQHAVTICCHEAEWARHPAAYDQHLGPHVTVVHNRNRAELIELYAQHDIAVMPYGTLNSDWAMPVKFPEAIGMEMPVLAGAGTAVGRVVDEQTIGWTVGPAPDDFHAWLSRVDRVELERVRTRLLRVRPTYTWAERAREVAEIAGGLSAAKGRRS
ncbi:MAG TPA: glycosyltransferase [Patescibacteria group bacterium]|nr:glycosyltransferase [Patescibacteria group bacterium]